MIARHRTIVGAAASLALLAGCQHRAADPAVVTDAEQAQLNDAAATLDANGASADPDVDAPDGNSKDVK